MNRASLRATPVPAVVLLLFATALLAQSEFHDPATGKIRLAPIRMPYRGARNVPELSTVPGYLAEGGLMERLEDLCVLGAPIPTVKLTPEEQKDYGVWHRLGLANGHLARMVSQNRRAGLFNLGLLANCSSLLGVLGGLQHSGPTRKPLRVGLVFIDAHGDFNTPETTLSGMLGGMPVAVAAGDCLHNLRHKSGLDPALPPRYIVMAGVRDTDPLEQERIDRSGIEQISVEDIRTLSANLHAQMQRLSSLTDLIYVHVDLDVLDPVEVAGHPLTVPDGPTSLELSAALTEMFQYPKTAAFGVASTPAWDNDPQGLSLKAAYNLIEGALRGVLRRQPPTR